MAPQPQPKVKDAAFAKRWTKEKIDWFILAKLEQNKLQPSPEADRATLIERASLDLTGLRPTYEEVQAFVADKDPERLRKLIDRLLASPHYGERWGRYWLDVARYGEDNPTSEATNPPYPFAWRYRDWVIEAINKDVPYDQFREAATGCRSDARHAARRPSRARDIWAPRRSITRICGFRKTSPRRSSPMPGMSAWTPFRAACWA